MSNEPNNPNPTADWRKYPKGPNFFGIVVGASAVMLVLFVVAYFFLHADAQKMVPHTANPTPNSLVQPLLPGSVAAQRV